MASRFQQEVEVICVSESESSKICTEVSNKSDFPPSGSAQGIFISSNPPAHFTGTWSQPGLQKENVDSSHQVTKTSRFYAVKLVNPKKKSEYHVEKWRVDEDFYTVPEFEEKLKEKFDKLKGNVAFGYIEPGHGLKGRQQWIIDDQDIAEMYEVYKGKKEVILWCHLYYVEQVTVKTTKRKSEPATSKSKRIKCAEMNEEAFEDAKSIMSQLETKHGSKYSPEQYHGWAQLISIKKHASLDVTPDYTFFKGSKSSKSSSAAPSIAAPSGIAVPSNSPSKRIHARSELLNQLAKISRKGTFLRSDMTSCRVIFCKTDDF